MGTHTNETEPGHDSNIFLSLIRFGGCKIEFLVIVISKVTGSVVFRSVRLSCEINSGWFVRQYEHEYNPIHLHIGSSMSCVGYLALPEGIEKEWEEDYKDHHPDLLCVVRRKRGFFKKLWENNTILKKDFHSTTMPVLVLSGLK